jgi:hypothetical protein
MAHTHNATATAAGDVIVCILVIFPGVVIIVVVIFTQLIAVVVTVLADGMIRVIVSSAVELVFVYNVSIISISAAATAVAAMFGASVAIISICLMTSYNTNAVNRV